MQWVVIIGIGLIWLLIAIIQGISDAIDESKREKAKAEKRKSDEENAKERERFEVFKLSYQRVYEDEFEAWEKVIQAELEQMKPARDSEHERLIAEIEFKNSEIKTKCSELKASTKADWVAQKKAVDKKYQERLSELEALKQNYLQCNPLSVAKYCEIVLELIPNPAGFRKKYEIEYNAESRNLICNYVLPSPSEIPTLREIKWLKTKFEAKEFHYNESAINKIYDGVIYQIVLAALCVLFKADEGNALSSINFNGWVESIDKGTGHNVSACIVSVFTTKEVFTAINLKNVDAKECFKKLKGVGSSQLHSITPIPPIMKINTEDKRFVDSYAVAHNLSDEVNIAAMNWEDFEHLVREIFEKKFSKDGIEVKVTQSSRDKGVDAIAFDPDPIRGGKIVIQAKRYTNVVGVSAVRDLYGTVMNEGAIKGILVTTSNFGPDAYEFVKGKPLTLVSGGELLTLLMDAGYKAKIDLKEAKRMFAEQAATS